MNVNLNLKNGMLIVLRIAKWHFNYYILNKSFPLIATFQLTNVCNLKCKMCNVWQNSKKNTIPLEIFKKYMEDLGNFGCCYVSISGGEPLIVKNIEQYVYYAKQNIPMVNMVTNGFLLNKEMALKLNNTKIDTVSISIDAMKKNHDKIRGVDGAFDKAIESINNLKLHAPNIKIVMNTVISPWSIEDMPKLIDLADKLQICQKFQPINPHPTYNNPEVKKINYKITPDFIEKLNVIITKLKNKKNVLNSKYFLSAIPDFFLGKNIKGIFDETCILGYHYCDIRENNELYPCLNGMDAKGGLLIKDGNLKQAYQSEEYKRLQSNLINCKYCQKDFQICHLEPRITFPIKNLIKYSLSG